MKPDFDPSTISDLELDLLLLYYNFADQWGNVNTAAAANWAATNFGIVLHQDKFKLDQRHLDILMEREILPDIRLLLNKIVMMPPKKRRKKRNGKSDP